MVLGRIFVISTEKVAARRIVAAEVSRSFACVSLNSLVLVRSYARCSLNTSNCLFGSSLDQKLK